MVRNAMLHYHLPKMRDIVIVDIPKMQTTMFFTTDPKNFLIVCSVSPTMLSRFPTDNPIIVEYLKIAVNAGGDGSESIHEEEIPKKKEKSFKRTRKYIVSKKSKKQKRRNINHVVIEEESSEHTESLDRNEKESTLNNEEDFPNIGLKIATVSEPIQTSTPLVSSHMESQAKIYKQVVDGPFLNLSQTPLTPPIRYATSQFTQLIPNLQKRLLLLNPIGRRIETQASLITHLMWGQMSILV